MSNVDVPNDNDAANQEIEDPVDGPTPDWMKIATSSKSQSSLTEENTPSWLKAIKSGKPAAKEPEPETSDEASAELSDIEQLLAEEGVDLSTVAEERPDEAEGMTARDWMISTSDDEMIRKGVGAETAEEDMTQFPPVEAPPSESFDTGDEPFGGMSDIERLLAEEGVDLSTVAEERPPEAEGMTARDWMISTSDDEMIRNRVGAGLLDEDFAQDIEDEALEAAADTDADLPDWLRDVEGEVTEPIASAGEADDKMVVEEDLPDWLRDVEDEETEVPQPVAAAEEDEDLDDKMVIEEDLPDWLRDVDEGAGSESPPEAEISGPSEAEDEDLPDWLRDVEEQVSAEPEDVELMEAEVDSSDKMVVEEDLPDWLRDADEGEELPAEPVPQPVAAAGEVEDLDDKMVVEEDLPDWLRDVEEELEEEEPPTLAAEEVEELPEWLQEAAQEDEETTVGVAALVEPVTEVGDDLVEEDELPDWLQDVEVETEETLFDAERTELFEDEEFDEGELPEWLAEVQAGVDDAFEPSEPEPLELEEVGAEGLPDWLSEVEEESITVSAEVTEEPEAEPADAAARVESLIEEEELPDWLRAVDEEEPVEFEIEEEIAELTAAQLAAEPEAEVEVPSPELEPEMEIPVAEAELEEEAEELAPELELEAEEPVAEAELEAEVALAVAEAELEEAAEEPAPELEPEAEEPVPEAEVALAVAEAEFEEETAEPVPEPEPEPEPEAEVEAAEPVVSTPAPVAAVAGVPNWLKKLREEEYEKPAAAEPVMASLVSQPAPQAAAVASTTPEPEPEPQPRPVLDLPEDSDEQFKLAQGAREEGDVDRAIQIYESLVTSGVNLDGVIADLDLAIRSNPSNYMLYQVKGDAMMKDGRLQGALEAYRQALAKLAS